jgi:antitoxin YefM
MPLEDYNPIQETIHLLKNPKNAQRLYKALAELKAGKHQKRDLIE